MISIVIPAHNEAQVIRRTLSALHDKAIPGEFEIIVVCNGCNDETAAIAKSFAQDINVIETAVASKAHALNLGDAAAVGFPRIYCDADVVLSAESVRELARVLAEGFVLAAAPAVKTVFPLVTAWSVRAYYSLWMALPYVQEGMMAAGVYAVSRDGRQRFGRFPDLIADDGYFRLQFSSDERIEVPTACSTVSAPARLWDLILIKTRSRLGFYQLRSHYPQLFERESRAKGYGHAALAILKRPSLWLAVIPYLWVNVVSRHRAIRQYRRQEGYVWERDNSSRSSAAVKPINPLPPLESSEDLSKMGSSQHEESDANARSQG